MSIEEIQSMCRALSNLTGNYISVDISIRSHVTGSDMIDFEVFEITPLDQRMITHEKMRYTGDTINYLKSRIDAFLIVQGEK